MDENTVNQETTATEQEERTFTQSELNAIVQDRLARERSKYADYEELKEKNAAAASAEDEQQKLKNQLASLQAQLDARDKADSIRQIREKISAETGVPVNLLSAEDEEGCNSQAKAIMEFVGKRSYPSVHDGGETTKKPTTSKADILAIKNERERLRAIQENIELFK